MKLTELHEALVDKPVTAADIEFSISKIDEVIAALEKLREKHKTKSSQTAIDMAVSKMGLAKEIHGDLEKFNVIKRKLDTSHRAKDLEKFEAACKELHEFLRAFNLSKKLGDAKRGKIHWKVSATYEKKLIQMLDTMAAVRDNVTTVLKRMKMTDAQRASADKASAAMRARWGSF